MAALVLNVFEGAIRKWLLPGAGDLVYFLTDFVLLSTYIAFWASYRSRTIIEETRIVSFWLAAVTVVICVNAFNPCLGSIVVGIFGAKCYLLYPLMIYPVSRLFDTDEDFYRFCRWYMIIAIPVCLLGAAQFGAPADSIINRYASDEQVITTFGEGREVRITGTFAYISGHAAFLFIIAVLCLGIMATDRTLWGRVSAIIVMVLVAGNLLMSGSRSYVIMVGVLIVASFLLFGFRHEVVGRRLRVLLVAGMVAVFCAVATQYRNAYEAFLYRTTTSEDEFEERAFQDSDFLFIVADYAGPFGLGSGMTHPGGAALRRELHLPGPAVIVPEFEAEYTRLLLELGMVGFVLWYGLRIAVIIAILKTYWHIRSLELRFWVFLILMVHLLTLTSTVVLNHTYGLYYWFLAGVAFALRRLDAQNPEAKKEHFSVREVWPALANAR